MSTTYYTYDANGNLTFVNYPAGTTDITYGYDALNRVNTMTDATGTTIFTYEPNGQMETENGPWASDTVTYDYNGAMKRSSVSVQQPGASAWTQTYLYDAAGRLDSTTSSAGTFDYFTYLNASDRVTRLNNPGGSRIENQYDSVARQTHTWLKTSGGLIRNHHGYDYDLAGRRTQQTKTSGNYVVYDYDFNGQLKTSNGFTSGGSPLVGQQMGYTYDFAWNLNTRVTDGSTESFQVNTSNELVTVNAVPCSYDANGNITYDGSRYYTYDAENQLTVITDQSTLRSEFVYDGKQRRRIRREYTSSNGGVNWTLVKEVRYVYDGNLVLQERNGSNAVQVTYTRGSDLSGTLQGAGGIGGLLARTPYGGASAFYHADGNGNITAMINTSQNLVAQYDYDGFGRLIASSGSLAADNLYRFSSKEFHAETGLVYYLYRYYDPVFQRWVNRDPIAEDGGINLYGFVSNSPISSYDPLGESDNNRPPSLIIGGPNGDIFYGAPKPEPGNFIPPISIGDLVGDTLILIDILNPIAPGPTGEGVIIGGAIKWAGKTPSLSACKAALQKVYDRVGKLKRNKKDSKYGGNMAGDSNKGYRLEDGHTRHKPPHPESGPHFNYWDYTNGKRRQPGGIKGAEPIN